MSIATLPPDDAPTSWWDSHRSSVSSSAASLIVHLVIVFVLALLVFPKERVRPDFVVVQTEVVNNPVVDTEESFKVQPPKLIDGEVNSLASLTPPTNVVSEQPNLLTIDVDQTQLTAMAEAQEFLGQQHRTGDFAARSEQARSMMANAFGGNASTEAAVNNGLKWLAEHQRPDGSWNFNHRHDRCDDGCGNAGNLNQATVAATSLAMMSYLGAGHTHKRGTYQPQMERAVNYLLTINAQAEVRGDLRELPSQNSAFYTQGLATIALCESYGMTGDRSILKAAQQCVNFTLDSQHPEAGGWRYRIGQEGDTSVVGWQVMALASARMSHIAVPPKSQVLSNRFLDRVQLENGVYYGYDAPSKKPSTTAAGLLCRLYLGWEANRPELQKGAAYLGSLGPSRDDMYYNYYATQVMHHHGGPLWTTWNDVMREQLLSTQDRTGHAAGSWPPRDTHGAGPGGRHYMTCLAILTLEVYYRHLPLYQRQSVGGKDF